MLTLPQGMLLFVIAIFVIILIIFIIRMTNKLLIRNADNLTNYYILNDVAATDKTEFRDIYDKMMARYKTLNFFIILTMLAVIILTAIICGRPGKSVAHNEQVESRDIVLCLDVSGSSLLYDQKILEAYQEIVKNFSGERIGLQIFDSTSKTLFPLTNDYNTVSNLLNRSVSALSPLQSNTTLDILSNYDKMNLLEFLAGTNYKTDSASLIGDGLVNCALAFGEYDSQRPRSIIFATDNQLAGNPLFSLDDAFNYINEHEIQVYAIYTGNSADEGQNDEVMLKNTVVSHSGMYFTTKTANTINTIVSQINAEQQDAVNYDGLFSVEDNPGLIIYFFFGIFVLYLFICWRLRS